MDVDVKGAAIGIASAVFASVGFLLSLFAVVLNPLIPASADAEHFIPAHHSHLNLRGRPRHLRPDSEGTSSVTESFTSVSSQAPSSPGHECLPSHPESPNERERSGSPTPKPLRRTSTRRVTSLSTANDYFSLDPAASSKRDIGIEMRGTDIVPVIPTLEPPVPVAVPTPSLPAVSHPSSSKIPIPPSPSPPRPRTPPASQSISNATPPGTPIKKSLTCDLTEPQPPQPHSFRILHFKRSWTNQRNKPTRSVTCPEHPPFSHSATNANAKVIPNSTPTPAISRPPSTASIKHLCSVKKTEKTLRKSLSSPESGLSKWKSHCRRNTSSSNMHADASQPQAQPQLPPQTLRKPQPAKLPQSTLPARPRTQPQPPLRTQPYEAPYFFPSPASPDAAGYVRRARSGRPSSSYASFNTNHNTASSGQFPSSQLGQMYLVEDVVGGDIHDEKSRRVVASAPPTKLKFSG